MDEKELLKYAVDSGILDIALVQEQVEMNKREKILRNTHMIYGKGKMGIGEPIFHARRKGESYLRKKIGSILKMRLSIIYRFKKKIQPLMKCLKSGTTGGWH